MENYLLGELQAGKTVEVNINVGYSISGSVRPENFVVNAMIDGRPWSKDFKQ